MIATLLDGAHPHLLVNHLPVVLAPCALVLLLSGIWFRSRHLERAGLIACIAVTLTGIASYWTGEPAEEVVQGLPGVTGPILGEHAEAGNFALQCALVLGPIALVTLVLSLRRAVTPKVALWTSVLLAALAVAIFARTAYLGGLIRHTEIRAGAVTGSDPR